MNEIVVFIGLLFLSAIGFVIIRGFDLLPRKETLLTVGSSYGLGVGLVSFQLYVYSRFGIVWQKEFILYPWILFLIGIVIVKKTQFSYTLPKIPQLRFFEKILVASIILTFLYVLFEALLRPLGVWDGWATWLLESKVFFIDGKISYDNLQYMQASYPLIFPLLGTYIYTLLGHVDDTAVLVSSVAFYGYLSLSFFAVLKKSYSFRYALLGTFLLMTLQNLIRHGGRLEAGIADLPLGYYIFLSVYFLSKYIEGSSVKILFLLCIFLGITGLVKNEGIPFMLISSSIIMYHIYKRKLFSHILSLLIPFCLLADWQIFMKANKIDQIYIQGHPFEMSINKTLTTIIGILQEFIRFKSWSLLWITYFFTVFSFRSRYKNDLILFHSIIFFQLSSYVFMYLTRFGNAPESSVERLLVHVAPIALYTVLIQVQEIKSFSIKKLLS